MRHGRNWWVPVILATMLTWDYAAHPELAGFLIFVRADGQAYDWQRPMGAVDVLSKGLVVEVACATLPLRGPGPWSAVVRAMDGGGELSEPSNEVSFTWSRQMGCGDIGSVPPPTRAPRVPLPPVDPRPPMPDLTTMFPPVVWQPPRGAAPSVRGGTLDDLTESCAWRGCQAPPVPPMTDEGPPMTERPQWRGR
jgi:hypothetical protein